jgi:hypothetical protein
LPSDRYLRLITIDLSVLAFVAGFIILGLGFWAGLWISTSYVEYSGMTLFWVILAVGFLLSSGTVLIVISVKTILKARKEYREMFTRSETA